MASVAWISASPLALVIFLSVVIGFAMVVLFRYTSDQKAIHVAKDQVKAHLLAVRLFQDQLPVVLRSYGRIVRGTGVYLRLAFKPLLLVIIPITLLIVQLDRYLGWTPVPPSESFLLKARVKNPAALDQLSLQLPPEVNLSAPAVHIPEENEIVWRLLAGKKGTYKVDVQSGDQSFSKQVVVSPTPQWISTTRSQAPYWERFFTSGEPAIPAASPVQTIEVNYPTRSIAFAWLEWNWIVLFFILSLVAGFIFKSILGIEI